MLAGQVIELWREGIWLLAKIAARPAKEWWYVDGEETQVLVGWVEITDERYQLPFKRHRIFACHEGRLWRSQQQLTLF